MSYFLQPGSKTFRQEPAHFPLDRASPFTLRDPLKTKDIEGATPAEIPGYTGTKPGVLLSHIALANDDLRGNEGSAQWKTSKHVSNKLAFFNPAISREYRNMPLFTAGAGAGMLPTTTDAKVLSSQSVYRYRLRSDRIVPKKTTGRHEANEIEDTFERYENDLKNRERENNQQEIFKRSENEKNSRYENFDRTERPNEERKLHKDESRAWLADNANRILSMSKSVDKLGKNFQNLKESTKNFANHGEKFPDRAQPKLQPENGYDELVKNYEKLYWRRSVGMAPTTDVAKAHKEIDEGIRNRETAAYGRSVDFPHLNNPSYHKKPKTRRMYDILSNNVTNSV